MLLTSFTFAFRLVGRLRLRVFRAERPRAALHKLRERETAAILRRELPQTSAGSLQGCAAWDTMKRHSEYFRKPLWFVFANIGLIIC